MSDQVDIVKVLYLGSGSEDVEKADDILVVHVLQESQLPVGPLGVDGRLKGSGQLLYGHFHVPRLVCRCTEREEKEGGDEEEGHTHCGSLTRLGHKHLSRLAGGSGICRALPTQFCSTPLCGSLASLWPSPLLASWTLPLLLSPKPTDG